MTIDAILLIVGLPLFAHACLAFLQSFWTGPSQYTDLLEIPIQGLNSIITVDELFRKPITNTMFCKLLLSSALIWSPRLRVLGLLPILLYLSAFMTSILPDKIFLEAVQLSYISRMFAIAGLLVQVFYVLLKLRSRIPDLLKCLHGRYTNANRLYILIDIVPLTTI